MLVLTLFTENICVGSLRNAKSYKIRLYAQLIIYILAHTRSFKIVKIISEYKVKSLIDLIITYGNQFLDYQKSLKKVFFYYDQVLLLYIIFFICLYILNKNPFILSQYPLWYNHYTRNFYSLLSLSIFSFNMLVQHRHMFFHYDHDFCIYHNNNFYSFLYSYSLRMNPF